MGVALIRVSQKMASFSCNSMVRGYHVYKDNSMVRGYHVYKDNSMVRGYHVYKDVWAATYGRDQMVQH